MIIFSFLGGLMILAFCYILIGSITYIITKHYKLPGNQYFDEEERFGMWPVIWAIISFELIGIIFKNWIDFMDKNL